MRRKSAFPVGIKQQRERKALVRGGIGREAVVVCRMSSLFKYCLVMRSFRIACVFDTRGLTLSLEYHRTLLLQAGREREQQRGCESLILLSTPYIVRSCSAPSRPLCAMGLGE